MRILTAMGNSALNDRLKEEEGIDVIEKDIQYQEGILDTLEINKNVDILAISNLLPEEMDFCYLIDKIKREHKEIEIAVFLDKEDVDIENFLNSKKIYRIYYLDENGIDVFINSLRSNNTVSMGISEEIESLKKIILNPQEENKSKWIQKEKSVIAITGNPGSGKSIITCLLAKQIEKQKKKVAILEYSSYGGSIETIFGIRLKENFKKYSKNIDIYSFSKEEIKHYEIGELINKIEKEHDFVIIDTGTNEEFKHIKAILSCSDKVVFLLEPNLLGVYKAKTMLEIFVTDYGVNVDKIKIVFNKSNKYQITESILEEVFSNFENIGNISYDEKYDSFINKHLSLIDEINLYEIIYEN